MYEDTIKYGVSKAEVRKVLDTKFGKKLAVFGTDMSGFTRLFKKYGPLHFLRLIVIQRAMLRPVVHSHGGQVLGFAGDNIIAAFPEPGSAFRAAKEAIASVAAHNREVEEDSKVIITVGVHYAFVYQHDGELFGVEAEYAEWLGEEGGDKMEVVMSAEAHEHLAETISGELAGAKAAEEKFEGELRKRFCLPCAPEAS